MKIAKEMSISLRLSEERDEDGVIIATLFIETCEFKSRLNVGVYETATDLIDCDVQRWRHNAELLFAPIINESVEIRIGFDLSVKREGQTITFFDRYYENELTFLITSQFMEQLRPIILAIPKYLKQ